MAAIKWKLTNWEGACHGSAMSCSLQPRAGRSLQVTFAPPGDWLNPYPLDKRVKLGSWFVKINSATINADAEVEAVVDQYGHPLNPPPPAGKQYTLVNVSLTYAGDTEGFPEEYQLLAEGTGKKAHLTYPGGCRPPTPHFTDGGVSKGQGQTGNLCYQINSFDASTLQLRAVIPLGGRKFYTVWFALH